PVIWSLPTALMVGELSAALPEEGGYYAWVRRALGPFWGVQEAWLSLAASVFDMALYPTIFVTYLARPWPGLREGSPAWAIGAAVVAACALANILGTRAVGWASVAMTAVLLGPFVVLTAVAFVRAPDAAAGVSPPGSFDLLGGILVAMWNYMGWDNASTIAGEVEQPQRTYPLAMITAVALVTGTYLLPILAATRTGIASSAWENGSWVNVAEA